MKITSPTLLVDEQKCRANIRRMAEKAAQNNLEFRPHFKTHQSADIGAWYREAGVSGITVSSVSMAQYFRKHGWKDITIAFPVNLREIATINDLAAQIDLTLLISDPNTIEELQNQLSAPVEVFVEIDTGSGRTGFTPGDSGLLDDAIQLIQNKDITHFKGFYSHPGHSYSARSKKEILTIYQDVLTQCRNLKTKYATAADNLKVCIGDTPCCSVAEEFGPVDQISPGNFVFYDVMQTRIGSCRTEDIAVALACPIVAKYPERMELIIHGGAVHLSKERLNNNSFTHFGLPILLDENNSWSAPVTGNYVRSISQEHGIIKCNKELFTKLNVGDLVGILPVHSCLTADLMSEYYTLSGKRLNHIRNS